MKTGQDGAIDNEDILMLITLFTSNSIKHAEKHIDLSNRSTITVDDLKYCMIYETMEFLSNPNLNDEIMRLKESLSLENSDDDDDDDEEMLDCTIIPDEDVTEFKELDKFEISKIPNGDDRAFISKLYKHNKNWNTWIPETPLETILHKAINGSY